MCCKIHSLAKKASQWCEACPCHRDWDRIGLSSTNKLAQKLMFDVTEAEAGRGLKLACPCGGKNAPGFAAGDFDSFLEQLANMSVQEVIAHTFSVIDREVASMVVSDFETAKVIFVDGLVQKTTFWKCLPYSLAGLAHSRKEKRVASARVSLQSFDHAPAGTTHHRLTILFLAKGGRLRPFVEDVARESDIDETRPGSTTYRTRVAAFRFMDCVERSIEGRHSVAHRYSTFKPTKLCKLSNKMRLPELERFLLLEPSSFSNFVACMRRARRPDTLAKQLGILMHPTLVQLSGCFPGTGRRPRSVES